VRTEIYNEELVDLLGVGMEEKHQITHPAVAATASSSASSSGYAHDYHENGNTKHVEWVK
jgi:hypothetical protein